MTIITKDLKLEWLIKNFKGRSVCVAILDSGIDGNIDGNLNAIYELDTEITDRFEFKKVSRELSKDKAGHGSGVAKILTGIAPDIDITSINVLNKINSCSDHMLMASLEFALSQRVQIINMSLATHREKNMLDFFHLCEKAYEKNITIIASKSNSIQYGIPAMFSSIISVADESFENKYNFRYLPNSVIEFWADGELIDYDPISKQKILRRGTSYSTPRITGIVALLLEAYPGLTSFEIKTALKHLAVS